MMNQNQVGIKIIQDEKVDQDVFKTNEQKISIKLLDCKSLAEIFDLYKEYDKENLTPQIQILFFYFSSQFKDGGFEQMRKELQQISLNVMNDLKELDQTYFASFIWSLGIFCFDQQNNIYDFQMKQNIYEEIKKRYKFLNVTQASNMIYSSFQIYNNINERQILYDIVQLLSDVCLVHKNQLETQQIFNFIIIYQQINFKESRILDPFLDLMLDKKDKLKINEICKIITYLDEIKYDQLEIYQEFIEMISDHNLSLENTCLLLTSQCNRNQINQNLLNNLIQSINHNKFQINIVDYVNIWISIARIQNQLNSDQKTQITDQLKITLENSKQFKIDELLSFEIVNILVACSSMKVNDKKFIQILITNLFQKFDELEKDDLLNLARSFAIYVKQFESFFIVIHDQCIKNYDLFNKQEILLLKQTFNRTKNLFPNSKLIDDTIN